MRIRKATPWFSVSGLTGPIAKALYDGLEGMMQDALRKEFEDESLKVCFIGTPFPRTPFPLLAAEKHRARNPEAQVTRSWSRMIDYGIDILDPTLEACDAAFCRKAGLDIVYFAAACQKWKKRRTEAIDLHHEYVRNVLMGRFGLQPPHYILVDAEIESIVKALIEAFPDLKGLENGALEDYLALLLKETGDYFDSAHGQNPPCIIKYKSVPAMCEEALPFVVTELRRYRGQ